MKTENPTLYEKVLLHYVKSYTDNNRSVYQSNKKLSEIIDVSESSISSMISRMIKFGYLKKEILEGNRHLKYTGKPFVQIPLYADSNRAEFAILKKTNKALMSENMQLKLEINELNKKIEELTKD